MSATFRDHLGAHPSSEPLSNQIAHLSSLLSAANAHSPEVKSYPDAVYFNYFQLGLSLLFKPVDGYKPGTGLKRTELCDDHLILDSIDIYNQSSATSKSTSRSERVFASYPLSPFKITLPRSGDQDTHVPSATLDVSSGTTGKDFVACFGEPDRKGGGEGPSSGSIGIWCEWSRDGVMVEFGGDEARGPQAWELGKDARWRVITMFPPKKA